MACFNTIPLYWAFEISVPFSVHFSAAKSSAKDSYKYGKTQKHITAPGGGNARAVSKSMAAGMAGMQSEDLDGKGDTRFSRSDISYGSKREGKGINNDLFLVPVKSAFFD